MDVKLKLCSFLSLQDGWDKEGIKKLKPEEEQNEYLREKIAASGKIFSFYILLWVMVIHHLNGLVVVTPLRM